MSDTHVHAIGTGGKCTIEGCAFEFKVPRFCFDINVYDNEKQTTVFSDAFNCSSASPIEKSLDELKVKLESIL